MTEKKQQFDDEKLKLFIERMKEYKANHEEILEFLVFLSNVLRDKQIL